MPRTKPITRKGPGGIICRRQLATRDDSLSRVVAQTVVTNANLDRNEACMAACTTAAEVISEIPRPINCVVLEDALGKALSAFDMTDWGSCLLLLRPIGFGVLLRSGLLEATAGVCLRFSQQLNCQCGKVWGVDQIYDACLRPCLVGR